VEKAADAVSSVGEHLPSKGVPRTAAGMKGVATVSTSWEDKSLSESPSASASVSGRSRRKADLGTSVQL
jgi:hypothetical protein